MKYFPVYLLFILLVSCSKSTPTAVVVPPVIIPPVLDSTYIQHGTPFAYMPDSRDVTIYQVNMRVFNPGTFQSVISRLDSIKALGVNVIYLMPVYPVGQLKAFNSPYCVKDYRAVNTEFGSLQDLKGLVDAAHNRNMAVILDWVANHTSWDNSWISNKAWYLQDGSGNIISPPGMGWSDVAQLDFTNTDMRLAMINAMRYWVYNANIDGFRCDYADGPPADFWKQAIDTLRNIKTHKFLMLAEGSRSSNYSAGFDYNFGFNFFSTLKTIYSSNTSVLSIDNLNNTEYTSATGNQQVVRYTSNHDVDGSDGTPLQLFGGKDGSLASFVVVVYMKSVPMIYTGQEVGTAVKFIFPFTGAKVDWTINPDVTAAYKKIIAFRNNSAAIRQGQLTSYSTADVCAFTKVLGTDSVLVLVNLRNKVINYTLPAAIANSNWTDAYNASAIALTSQVSLQPYIYMVMKK